MPQIQNFETHGTVEVGWVSSCFVYCLRINSTNVMSRMTYGHFICVNVCQRL